MTVRSSWITGTLVLAISTLALSRPVAGQEPTPTPAVAPAAPELTSDTPDLEPAFFTGGRYRITPGDVIEFTFPRVPELNQLLTVQPDGYITLREAGEVRAQGKTVPELQVLLYEAYERVLRDPVITIVLKEFEKPAFVVSGEVKTPGKFELRGSVTVVQALALAGGFNESSKRTQVILFRRFTEDLLEVKEINVKKMFDSRDLSEDYILRPGDTILVPKSTFSKIKPFIPTASFGFYLNPFAF